MTENGIGNYIKVQSWLLFHYAVKPALVSTSIKQ
jgi:hypothetical protein